MLIAQGGGTAAFGFDTVTFALLALTFMVLVPPRYRTTGRVGPRGPSASGLVMVRRDRELAGLIGLTFGFYFLFGPVFAALPLRVAAEPHGSAARLAAYYTAIGIGAVVGGLLTGYLRRWPQRPATVALVVATGATLASLGSAMPSSVLVVFFGLCGLCWAPYPPWSCRSSKAPPRRSTSHLCSPLTAPPWCSRCPWAPRWAVPWSLWRERIPR